MSFVSTPTASPADDDADLLWSFLHSLSVSSDAQTGASEAKQQSDDASALIDVLHRANAAQSPATRLYSHALESIFGFCSLVDLLSAAATHRAWRRAIPKMRCLRATLQLKHFTRQLHTVWVTQVAPHIVALEPSWDVKNAEMDAPLLAQLAHHMPHLESLSCEMFLLGESTGELVWPARLRSLTISFPSGPHVNTNWLLQTQTAVVRSFASLPLLDTLELRFPAHSPLTDFSLLSGCKSLRNLTWSWRDSAAKLTEAQARGLTRGLPTLERIYLPWMVSHLLPLLTAAPGPLHWTSIGRFDEPTGAINLEAVGELIVARLPQLSELTAACSAVEWLPRCRNLTALSLTRSLQSLVRYGPVSGRWKPGAEASLEQAGEALSKCVGLTCLSIRDIVMSDEWLRKVLGRLPALRTLMFSGDAVPDTLDSICSSAPELRRLELTALEHSLDSPHEAVSLAPLLSLRSLEECKLVCWIFVSEAEQWYSEVQKAQSMPRLTKFVVKQT